jgi:hypothetical protein
MTSTTSRRRPSPQIIFRNYRELVKPADAAKWFAIEPEILSR